MGFIIGAFFLFFLALTYSPSFLLIDMSQGTVSIFQYGAGPNGVMRTLGKFMLGSGAMFGYDISSLLRR